MHEEQIGKNHKSTIKNQHSEKQSRSDIICKCGVKIEPIVIGSRIIISAYCSKCMKSSLAEWSRQNLRRLRIDRIHRMKMAIINVVPRLYRNAHLRDLCPDLREALFDREPEQGLLLFGAPGVGKSHTLAALARYYILKNKSCRWANYRKLCREIRDTYRPNSTRSELDIVRPLLKCDYLILDDVGSMRSTRQTESEFSALLLLDILDDRIENCKPTFMSSNKSPDELAASFNDKISSRLNYLQFIRMVGADKRRKTGVETID